ncbi:uncharacterized protein LOC110828179, partial [Zootermopsis nevadensis]|uniref:uncharacterized protein LOC110828179 n=1 Tax=Zootermopsis nevadensis TaxID=136037 RepID=UPI000B8EE462
KWIIARNCDRGWRYVFVSEASTRATTVTIATAYAGGLEAAGNSTITAAYLYPNFSGTEGVGNETTGTEIPVIPAYIRITSMIFCFVILGIGVAGNIMVPIVILKTKDMRNSTNIFLMNLSVADLMVLLVCTPTVLVEVNTKPETWVLGEEMCKIVPFVELTVAHASVLTILAISFERYYAICEPLKASYVCTKARALIICLLAWLFAALFTSPILLIAQYDPFREYLDGSLVPACLTEVNTFWSTFFFIMIISLFFLVPLLVLIVLYAAMARHLMADPVTSAVKDLESTNTRARKQVVLMLGTVVLSFFICLIPFRVFTVWFIFVSAEQVHSLGVEGYYNILYFCRTMLYLNSAVNPILYNLMSSKFRNGFMRVCGLRRRDAVLLRRGTTSTSAYSSTRRCNSFGMTHRSSTEFSWRSASRYSVDSTQSSSPRSERRLRSTSFRRSVMIRTSILKRNGSCIQDDVMNCIEMRPCPESFILGHLRRYYPILGVADYHHELDLDGSTVAVCFTQADTFWTAFFFILSIVIFFVVPFVILLVLYTIIARHLMTHTGIIAPPCRYGSYTSGTQHTALRYRKQVVVMLGTVVLSFFLCLMPFRAFTLWIIVAPEEAVFSLDIEEYYNLLYFCRVMTYINSAINPILYNVMSSKFRDGFTRLCGLTSRNRAEVYLGRKGTLNTVSTTTTTNCSSGLQDSIWRRSVKMTLPESRTFKRTQSTHCGDVKGINNATCILLRSKSHLVCSTRNNVVRTGDEDGRRGHEESYV